MTIFIENIRSAFDSAPENEKRDAGEMVSTIMLVAGFSVVALLLVNWLGTAVLNKAADLASCIEGSNSYDGDESGSSAQCSGEDAAGEASFKNDEGYKSRFG